MVHVSQPSQYVLPHLSPSTLPCSLIATSILRCSLHPVSAVSVRVRKVISCRKRSSPFRSRLTSRILHTLRLTMAAMSVSSQVSVARVASAKTDEVPFSPIVAIYSPILLVFERDHPPLKVNGRPRCRDFALPLIRYRIRMVIATRVLLLGSDSLFTRNCQ